LHKQGAFRFLGTYQLTKETPKLPSWSVSAGVQGIGTGNPGYSTTFEKNFQTELGTWNAYAGLGWRSNENRTRFIGGTKFGFNNGLTVGFQDDGIDQNPFVTYRVGQVTGGIFLVNGKRTAYMLSVRF
jgi:hypothetical protein